MRWTAKVMRNGQTAIVWISPVKEDDPSTDAEASEGDALEQSKPP
jgi:hypothetical protein